jgi:hypothetical protein
MILKSVKIKKRWMRDKPLKFLKLLLVIALSSLSACTLAAAQTTIPAVESTIPSGEGNILNPASSSTSLPPTETTSASQSAPVPAAESYENLMSPVDLLASYFNGINRQEYQRAYGYWESPPNSYDEFVAGFTDTTNVQLIVQPPTRIEGAAGSLYVEIPAVLIALHRDGSQHTFAGCFVTRKSNLQPPDISEEDVWHLYQAQVEAVSNEAAILALLAQAC